MEEQEMRVIVARAGVIGFQVIKMLVTNKHDVVVIELDRNVCEADYADTGAVILNGNATDIRMLEKAGVRNSEVMACLVRNDSDNSACALLAKSLGVPSIIALLRKPEYEEAYRTVGVTQVISTTDILAHSSWWKSGSRKSGKFSQSAAARPKYTPSTFPLTPWSSD